MLVFGGPHRVTELIPGLRGLELATALVARHLNRMRLGRRQC